jgi:hypothetical protein
MSSRSRILAQQKAWAQAAGLKLIPPGYLESVDANLRQPMAAATLTAFQAGEAAELKDFPRHPAKLRALFSSAALVVNVFEHWTRHDPAPLLHALGVGAPDTGRAQDPGNAPGPGSTPTTGSAPGPGNAPSPDSTPTTGSTPGPGSAPSPGSTPPTGSTPTISGNIVRATEFEARFPISPDGTPPNLDVALRLADGRCIGIESKFTEWHEPRRPAKIRFKEKYFPAGLPLWTSRGLPACQALAQEIQHGHTRYRFLYATQLLKHALGLATQCRAFGLVYLYYEWSGPAAREHRRELAHFAGRAGAELAFHWLSYQELFQRLKQTPGVDAGYLAYLEARYFPHQ